MAVQQMRLTKFIEEYDIPRNNIYEMVRSRGFPAYKIGKCWYVDIPKFLKWREKEHERCYRWAE